MKNELHIGCIKNTLALAQTRRGYCAPNPSVGAIIVKDDEIIAMGVHHSSGSDHAEVAALKNLSHDLSTASLYVSLEPCCHFGKTPPCTDAIIKSGIKKVFYGYKDPNPEVNGGGAEKLEAAGVSCEFIHTPEADDFYRSYHHFVTTQTPWVTAKLAMSLDNIVAGPNGEPLNITGPEAKRQTFLYRKHSDAILTTAKTVIADDPQLNIRLDEDDVEYKPIYILDRHASIPSSAKILKNPAGATLLQSEDLNELIASIGADGIHDLWVEAGPTLFNALLEQGLVQRALIYVAPKLLGDGIRAFKGKALWAVQNNAISWYHYGIDAVCEINMYDSACQDRHPSIKSRTGLREYENSEIYEDQ